MKMSRLMERTRPILIWLICFSQIGLIVGCREHKKTKIPAYPGFTANGTAVSGSTGTSVGEDLFVLFRNLQTDPNRAKKLAYLKTRKAEFVSAVNDIFPNGQFQGIKALQPFIDLIRDGTLPDVSRSLQKVIQLLLNEPNQETLKALYQSGDKPDLVADPDTMMDFVGAFLQYPQIDDFFKALADVIEDNDGLGPNGQPDPNEKDLISEIFRFLSKKLKSLPQNPPQKAQGILDTILEHALKSCKLRGRPNLGGPAWAVRVDDNGNPKVRVDKATGTLFPPFVDNDGDGVADVNADGRPVDAQGNELEIPAFSTAGKSGNTLVTRDQEGRALVNGAELFEYFDAKNTVLGMLLLMTGDMLRANAPGDLVGALDKIVDRVNHDNGTSDPSDDYTTIDTSGPIGDLIWNQLEALKYAEAAKILSGMSAVMKADKQKTEQLLVNLGKIMKVAQTVKLPPMKGSPQQLLNDLVPLLDDVFEMNRHGTSSARAIFAAFRTKMQQVKGIPAGFARMMKYHDYSRRVLAGPGKPSAMSRLMGMMIEANQCDKWPFGNMATFYLKAMAGTKKILGIKISVKTINKIMKIGFLRKLACSKISSSNVKALEDFAKSGLLDALIPIAKAFDDQGQISLLKDIFVALANKYDTVLGPLEPMNVAIMESGAIEPMFENLALMNKVTVPSTGEKVADVVADFIAVMVDDDRTVTDRHGRQMPSLLHLLMDPMNQLMARAEARGVKKQLNAALVNTLGVAFETVKMNGKDVLKNHCLCEVVQNLMAELGKRVPTSASARANALTKEQGKMLSLLAKPEVSTLLSFAGRFLNSPSKQALNKAIASLLTPSPVAKGDTFGAIVRILAVKLQTQVNVQELNKVLRFVGDVIDPARGLVQPLLKTAVRLLTTSNGLYLVNTVRNALARSSKTGKRPLDVLSDIIDGVHAFDKTKGTHSKQTFQDFVKSIEDIYKFMRNKLPGIFNALS